MKTFYYKPSFYCYFSQLKANNRAEAWQKLQLLFPEYPNLINFQLV